MPNNTNDDNLFENLGQLLMPPAPTPKRGRKPGTPNSPVPNWEIKELRKEYAAITALNASAADAYIKWGAHLTAIKKSGKIPHGGWIPFIEEKLGADKRTAQKAMWAASHAHLRSELGDEEFMRKVYGNKAKDEEDEGDSEGKSAVNGAFGKEGENEEGEDKEEKDDGSQSGGPGKINFGDKAHPLSLNAFLDVLDEVYFDNESVSVKQKLNFCGQLIEHLEKRRKLLTEILESNPA